MIEVLSAFIVLVATPGAPAVVQATTAEAPDPDYEACIARVYANIKEGREEAARWAAEGGGPAARHCLAVADLAAGFPRLAAIRLEELSEENAAGDMLVRARLLSQAARAWLEADEPQTAQDALRRAYALAPESGELHLTAAAVYAANDKLQATIDAVDAAERDGFTPSEGYALRGRARYHPTHLSSEAILRAKVSRSRPITTTRPNRAYTDYVAKTGVSRYFCIDARRAFPAERRSSA